MTLKSDTDALEAIVEEAEALLIRLESLDEPQRVELLAGIKQIIAIARYRAGLGDASGRSAQ